MKIQIRFDDGPGPIGGRFIEVENEKGESINAGEWVQDGDDWLLLLDTDPHDRYEGHDLTPSTK